MSFIYHQERTAYRMVSIGDEYVLINRDGRQGHVVGGTEDRRSVEDGISGMEC